MIDRHEAAGSRVTEEVQVILIERHSPDAVSCVTMSGERKTFRQELREFKAEHGYFPAFRSDIALINVWQVKGPRELKNLKKQHAVYPCWDGQPTGSGWALLTADQQQWCREENQRIIEVAKRYKTWGQVYLRGLQLAEAV